MMTTVFRVRTIVDFPSFRRIYKAYLLTKCGLSNVFDAWNRKRFPI